MNTKSTDPVVLGFLLGMIVLLVVACGLIMALIRTATARLEHKRKQIESESRATLGGLGHHRPDIRHDAP